MMTHDWNPSALYKIGGRQCTFTRGVFNVTETGGFIAYHQNVEKDRIQILIDGCDKCDPRPFWVNVSMLEEADGFIECEYCAKALYPKVTGWMNPA